MNINSAGYPLYNIDKIDVMPTSPTFMFTKLVPITGRLSNRLQSGINIDLTETNEIRDKCVVTEESSKNKIMDNFESDASFFEEGLFDDLNTTELEDAEIRKRKGSDSILSGNQEQVEDYSEITVKSELEQYIKTEIPDESLPMVTHHLHSEVFIKEEPHDEVSEKSVDIKTENSASIESYLNENPLIFTNSCGLPNISMFKALLQYIEDDMPTFKDTTKFEQLLSVLIKLRKNKNDLYLNKYVFPSAYVHTVEVLYKKLMPWCNDPPNLSESPQVIRSEFLFSDRAVIIGVKTVLIEGTFESVKYLIGYTGFGEVFFVSKGFCEKMKLAKMTSESGMLDKLQDRDWILYSGPSVIYATQINKRNMTSAIKKSNVRHSEKLYKHVTSVINRLDDNFKVLQLIPDFMSHTNENTSFLDKLVYVCCMLLNMLPRITYK